MTRGGSGQVSAAYASARGVRNASLSESSVLSMRSCAPPALPQPLSPSSPRTVWGCQSPRPLPLEAPVQDHGVLTRLWSRPSDRAAERQERKVADEACAVEVGGRGVVGLRDGRGCSGERVSPAVWVIGESRIYSRASFERVGARTPREPLGRRVGGRPLARAARAG